MHDRYGRRRSARTGWSSADSWALVLLLVVNAAGLLALRLYKAPLAVASYLQDDALVHVAVFAALGLVLKLLFPALSWVRCLALLATLAFLTEVAQIAMPTRAADETDLLADEAGALAGHMIGAALTRLRRRRA